MPFLGALSAGVSRPNVYVQCPESRVPPKDLFGICGNPFGLDYHITRIAIGLKELSDNIQPARREDPLSWMDIPGRFSCTWMKRVSVRTLGQLNLRKIDGAHGRSDVGILDQLSRDLSADALLGFLSGAADMRCQNDIAQALQRRLQAHRCSMPAPWGTRRRRRPPDVLLSGLSQAHRDRPLCRGNC